MNKISALILGGILIVCASGCAKIKKSDAAVAHEAWEASLNDSLAVIRNQIERNNLEIDSMHNEVGRLLEDFVRVDDPRQVEAYSILRGWENKYPLSDTGLIARITEGERLELIAALKGGNFDVISVSAPGVGAVESGRVPFDQGLNYRADGLNTVAFSGAKADSVAALIAGAPSGKVTVSYGSAKRPLGAAQQDMIARTYRLTSTHMKAAMLEKQQLLLDQKCRVLSERIEKNKSTNQ